MTMNKRGGPPVKLFIVAAVFMGCIYFIYVYHGKLRDAEASAERYRRSDEAKVGQLQDSMKEKEVLQQKCETDRQEFLNRLSSLNSQHKMLKGQHDELEAENGRLQQESQKLRDDNANVEAQRSQEFNQMKQEKELEIASLKDQLANMKRQNDELQNEISSLKSQLENAQQQAAAAVQAMHDFQQQQQQNQGFQQQNVVQQNKQAPANVQDLVYQNLGQGQGQLAGQGQGQLAGQGQAQLPAQGLSMDGIQNMNQNIAAQNIGQNQNGQIPPAGLENQAAALAAAQLPVQLQKQQQQQGQGDFNNVGQADGQGGVDNAQHQMEAPHMGGEVPIRGAANQGDQDIAHPDIVENEGQIFKPDFNLNKFDDNDDKGNNEDNYHNADHPPEEDGDHDNRMQNEGPVNLQVQEPPNGNVDRAQHEAGGLNLNKDIQPLQAQGQAQEQGQILMPDIGLAKHKDGEVRVEGEGRKEAPLPHEREM